MDTHGNTIWIEVSKGALEHNLAEVRALVGPSVKIMAVVKADAYGHGMLGAARIFAEAGVDYLGVTTLEEGLGLRSGGIDTPVLVFSPLLPDQMEAAIVAGLDMTVCDLENGEALSQAASNVGKTVRIHVKVDTGMGRLGVQPGNCPDLMYRLINLAGIEVGGVYTHFANSGGKNLAAAWKQNQDFQKLIVTLKAKDIPVGICHASNSAGLLNLSDSYHDMVRPGTILYGQYPSSNVFTRIPLRETWELKTRIVSLKKLGVGDRVGYGSEFVASRPTIAAVLPIGYSDGFTLIPESIARRAAQPVRAMANKLLGVKTTTTVTINGKKASVIGRISMQMCSIDVTDISGVRVGDEVIVPARRTTVSCRIPRIYID